MVVSECVEFNATPVKKCRSFRRW